MKGMWVVVVLLFVVIAVLGYLLIVTPAPNTGTVATTTGTGNSADIDTPGTTPLNSRVVVDAPRSGAAVFKTFTVTGKAPGPWYFEASFPVQVRDVNNAVVGRGLATALSDWMTTEDVAFKADITVDSYTGPATLVLMRDNPSGLPENDDSVSIPITIQ
ncbi:MAG: Gmad2 immunoglobulin-like domain-containing protein [Candidatus Paceibacterota bacterium]